MLFTRDRTTTKMEAVKSPAFFTSVMGYWVHGRETFILCQNSCEIFSIGLEVAMDDGMKYNILACIAKTFDEH